MGNFGNRFAAGIILLGAMSSPATRTNAQSIWLPQRSGNQVALESLKIDYSTAAAGPTFFASVWYLSAQIQTTTHLALVSEIPASYIEFSRHSRISPHSSAALGNPYVGLLVRTVQSTVVAHAYVGPISRRTRRAFVTEVGVRLPLGSKHGTTAQQQGLWSDADRWEAFVPYLLTLRMRAGLDWGAAPGAKKLGTRFRIGPTLWLPTRGNGDAEIFADGLAGLWYEPANAMIGLTLTGRTALSESELRFRERSEFQLGMDATVAFDHVQPGIHCHLPLSDNGLFATGNVVDFVVGLNLTFLIDRAHGGRQRGEHGSAARP
jgi:hypothetical protein